MKTSALQRYKRLLISILPGNNTYQRFILLSSPRSGSTMLHTYLNSSTKIHSLGEQPWRDLEQGIDRNYFKAYPGIIRAVGYKVFYQFSEEAPYQARYHELKKDRNLKVIHLVRENTLAQYISEKLAWQRRAWTRKKETDTQHKISLDLQDFEAFIAQKRAQQTQCLQDFKDHSMISVAYESMIRDPSETLKEVQSFLGVTPRKLFTVMEKQGSYSLSDLLENEEEVRTKYPHFFQKT